MKSILISATLIALCATLVLGLKGPGRAYAGSGRYVTCSWGSIQYSQFDSGGYWVQIWIDERKECEMSFQPGDLLPRWQFAIRRRPSMQITVKAECNLHGIWANRLVL